MGTLAKCGKSLVITVNSFFGILGLVFLVSGVFMKMKPSFLDKISDTLMSKISDKIPKDAGVDLSVAISRRKKSRAWCKTMDIKLTDLLGDAATPFIIIGITLLAIVVWAYCAFCCKSKWMLIVYAAILTVVILGEVVVAIMLTTKRSTIDNAIKKPLKESLTKYYTGEKGKDIMSIGWNALMGMLKCCGVDGIDDFVTTESWNKTYSHDPGQGAAQLQIKVEGPILCCETQDPQCSKVGGTGHSYHHGCYDAIWDLIKQQKSIAIGVASGIGVLELLMWFSVVFVIRDISKDNKVAHKD